MKPGTLYVVATPIGNLADMTPRAVEVLKLAGRIAAEDTRHSAGLLRHFAISTPLFALHEHNERTVSAEVIRRLRQGEDIALISDAGTPLVSDPGFPLVRLAHEAGLRVVPVPGASALIAALSAAGLPTDRFVFEGFLPPKAGARRNLLAALRDERRTLIFYEAPHRVLEMLEDLVAVLGNRPVVVAREVTKIHEEFVRGSAAEVLARLRKKPVKGELTVLVGLPGGPVKRTPAARPLRADLERAMADGRLDLRAALKAVARERGISKSEAYRQYQMEKSPER